MNSWLTLIAEIKDKPILVLACVAVLIGVGGASVGAFATKSMVDEKHEVAMNKIGNVEQDQKQMQHQLDRMENKIDQLIFSRAK